MTMGTARMFFLCFVKTDFFIYFAPPIWYIHYKVYDYKTKSIAVLQLIFTFYNDVVNGKLFSIIAFLLRHVDAICG